MMGRDLASPGTVTLVLQSLLAVALFLTGTGALVILLHHQCVKQEAFSLFNKTYTCKVIEPARAPTKESK